MSRRHRTSRSPTALRRRRSPRVRDGHAPRGAPRHDRWYRSPHRRGSRPDALARSRPTRRRSSSVRGAPHGDRDAGGARILRPGVQRDTSLPSPPSDFARDLPPGRRSRPPRRDVDLYSAFTGIIVPFEAGVFGSVTTSNPFLNVAATLLPSTAIGSRTLRRNAP